LGLALPWQLLDVRYPEHVSLIRYCHIADVVSYAEATDAAAEP